MKETFCAGAQELIGNTLWWNGPDFPWNSCEDWDSVDDILLITLDDQKVKKNSMGGSQI